MSYGMVLVRRTCSAGAGLPYGALAEGSPFTVDASRFKT